MLLKSLLAAITMSLLMVKAYCSIRSKRSGMRDLIDMQNEGLFWHNKYRAWHRAKPLKLNETMNKYAQKHAYYLAGINRLVLSGGMFGENLFAGALDTKPQDACYSWYKESEYYEYERKTPSNLQRIGHFTQMIWRNSTQLGIGYAPSNRKIWKYIVALYYPPGNVMGEFIENVSSPW